MTTVLPPLFPGSPEAPVLPVEPVEPVAPVSPVAPFSACAPVAPVAPVGPAGPGAGTTTAGVTTVGLSHALNVRAVSTAVNNIEYFMEFPLFGLTKAVPLRVSSYLGMPANMLQIFLRFCSLGHITPLARGLQNRCQPGCLEVPQVHSNSAPARLWVALYSAYTWVNSAPIKKICDE